MILCNRRGLTPVVIVIAVAAVAIAGYFFFSKQKTSTLPPLTKEMQKAQQEVLGSCKYDKEFCQYAANGVVALSNGYTITSETIFDGKKSKSIVSVDGKGNIDMSSFNDGKEDGRTIILDKIMYTKAPNETVWTEFPKSEDENSETTDFGFDVDAMKKELEGAIKETNDSLVVKKVGNEKCGSMNCVIFEMKETTLNTTTRIWVDTKEYLARKMETVMKEGTTTMTYDYKSVSIAKPSPVKQMPSVDQMMKDSGVEVDMSKIKELMKDVPQGVENMTAPEEMSNE